ncbi:SH3 domain-containing protein [Nitratireductor rhodophyticola]
MSLISPSGGFEMMCNSLLRLVLAAVFLSGFSASGRCDLAYELGQTDDGLSFLIVQGDFTIDDDLAEFTAAVRAVNPSVVTFNSSGGNVVKAMELGRLIRAYKLNTIQFRSLECSSACALAFLGGVVRIALPGSIGVHRASFADGHQMSADDAVSSVQAMTAEVMSYMYNMGADPGLLQLSLRYDASDMRYLSVSEMQQFKVVTNIGDAPAEKPASTYAPPIPPSPEVAKAPSTPPRSADSLTIPTPRSGRIRHPKGQVPLKAKADGKSPNLATLSNGTPLQILGNEERWYRVRVRGFTGYLHHTWVYVDQFDSGPFAHRHIQVKSFADLESAKAFVRSSSLPVAAYLATNGWFAITLEDTFEQAVAKTLVSEMKARGVIPDDSFMTYGNTYVRKVCCR